MDVLKLDDSDFAQYIGTALWSSSDDSDEAEYLDSEYSIDDFDPATLKGMRDEIEVFVHKFFELVDDKDEHTSIGNFVHNVWLTRNSHGAGFWDAGYKNGGVLTEECIGIGEVNLYIGDDKKIHKDGGR